MIQTSVRFQACMPFVLKEEGGYSNTLGDHGGATNYGIIQREYDIYRHSKGLPLQSVRLIAPSEYMEIYWSEYWMPHCPALPVGLDLSVFNINVNGGTGRGTRLLQAVLGLQVDGVWGKDTDAHVSAIQNNPVEIPSLIRAFHDDERAFYKAIVAHNPSQAKFLSDWLGRNDRCEALSLKMAAQATLTS